jgi:hypothetical protein
MKFKLTKIYPKVKDLGLQEVKISNGEAVCFREGGTVARLVEISTPQMTSRCLYLRGLEEIGSDAKGTERFIKQEWQLTTEE